MLRLARLKALALLIFISCGIISRAQPGFALSSSVCAGTEVTVTASTGTFAANSYTWSALPSGPVFSSVSASLTPISFPVSGTYTIVLSVSDGTSSLQVQNVITVQPAPYITIASTATSVCTGRDATLTASGAVSYSWALLPGLYYYAGNTAYVLPSVTTVYTVTGSDAAGCTDMAVYSVGVDNLPNLVASASTASVCANTTATLTASGATTYTWMGGSQTVHQPALVAGQGTYTVIGANGACVDTAYLTVMPAPDLSVTVSATRNTICINDADSSSAVGLSASGATYYSWSPYDPARMSYSLGASTAVSPTVTTCYTVTASTAACKATQQICVNVSTCTALPENSGIATLEVFPNPVSEKLYIRSQDKHPVTIRLVSISGDVLVNETYEANNERPQEINIGSYSPGIYFLYISSGGSAIATKRIIKL